MIERGCLPAVAVVAALVMPLDAFADPLIDTLLRVTGLTAAPSHLRGPEDVEAGNIWIAALDRLTASVVTRDGGYRSPIFSPSGGSLLALKGGTVVRIFENGATPIPLHLVTG